MYSNAAAWLYSVQRHLQSYQEHFGTSGFHTVYLGGGTPSWLPSEILRKTLKLLATRTRAGGEEPVELTVEANPEDLNDEFLHILADAGVNRLSVGVQSLEDKARQIAGRRGNARDTMLRLEKLSRNWNARWSADLMFGLPEQTPWGIAQDAQMLTDLGAGHVSLYELTVESGTPLHAASESGTVQLPDEDEQAEIYEAAAEVLAGAGFERYEVSNWAKPGNKSIHNEVYWAMGSWLAVGPSGVGNIDKKNGSFLRLENSHDDGQYFCNPEASMQEIVVSGIDAMFECLMTALRTSKGLDINNFRDRFGHDVFTVFGKPHEKYPELMMFDGITLKATGRGLDLLNVPLVAALKSADHYKNATGNNKGALS